MKKNFSRFINQASIISIFIFFGMIFAVRAVAEKAESTADKKSESKTKTMNFEIWPGSRRVNNTVYLIGNEYNHIFFNLSASKRNLGKYKLQLPIILKKPVTLILDYPEIVKYKGTAGQDHQLLEETLTTVKHDGKSYNRHIIRLKQDGRQGLDFRLIKNDYDYRLFSYLIAPAKLNGKIYWQLKYGDEILLEESSHLITVGTIDPNAKLPKRFTYGFSGGGVLWSFPDGKYNMLADLYRRLGVTSTDIGYYINYTEISERKKAFCDAFHDAGLSINVIRGGSFTKYRRSNPDKYGEKGLVWGVHKEAELCNQEKERAAFALIAPYADGYTFDYEPIGPQRIPGYDDKPTIAAFAKKYGIKEKLTERLLKGKYREKYFRYRQELLTEPIKAVRNMVDTVKKVPIYLEQGSGIGANVDYKLYDKYVDFHCPMIYTSSMIDYYTKILAMAKYIDHKKLVPDTTYGYTFSHVTRQTPGDVTLDIVAAAAAGASGQRVWPGLPTIDEGLLWGACEGLKMVAVAEDFYFDGKDSNEIAVKGLTYKDKVIKVGSKTLKLSFPDWPANLRYRIHKLNNEYLITLLNFNSFQDAYIETKGDVLRNKLLINPSTGNYLKVNNSGIATVKLKKSSPAIWIVTAPDSSRAKSTELNQSDILAEYQQRKADFKRDNKDNDTIAIGKKDDIDINYNSVKIDGNELICLKVSTPEQQVSFSENGGRIFKWEVDGKNIVASEKLSRDGFAMDLLWLPSSARWSGDEIQTMKLTACENDGAIATIVYRGEFKLALPGLKIEKTFQINANDKTIKVSIKLLNELVLPVTVSYWSHNTMTEAASGIYYLKNGELVQKQTKTSTTIFPSQHLPEAEKNHVFSRKNIVDEIDNVYAEIFKDSNDALVLRLPKNFMNVYRYKNGTEWMSRPITIGPTNSVILNFSYTIMSKTQAAELNNKSTDVTIKKMMRPITKISTHNLLPVFDDKDNDGFPDAYKMRKGKGKENVSYVSKASIPTLKIKGTPDDKLIFETTARIKLEKNKKYLFSVELKIDKMRFSGRWYKDHRGFWIYVYGRHNMHKWMAVAGNGSTNGWITVMLPFNTIGEKNENLCDSNIIFIIDHTAGTFYARNPLLIERNSNDEMKQHYIKADGSTIVNSRFTPSH